MPGLYWVVRRAYTVASFAALSWLVHGGCTAGNVIYVALVLCSSSFGTLLFLGIRRTTSTREEEITQEKGRRRTGGGEEEGRRRPGGGQEEGPHHPNLKVLLCGCVFRILLYIPFYSFRFEFSFCFLFLFILLTSVLI